MRQEDLPVICRACQREFRLSQIKFDDVRKAYVCVSCHNASKKPSSLLSKKKEEDKPENVRDQMVKYSCPDCRYHFMRKKEKVVKECPYCASKKLNVAS